jgi:ABC-2 type transport system permease protein
MRSAVLGYEFARISFITMLTHRLRYVIGVLNYFIYVSVNWYLWGAVFQHQDVIQTWTLEAMRTYVCVNWIARSIYFSNSDNLLAARINKGEITSDLLRPSSLVLQFYAQALGEMLFRAVFMGVPIGIAVVLIYGLEPPVSLAHGTAFLVSILLAFHLFFALCAVFTEKLQGFLWAKFILFQFLSGLLLPLEFFPASVRQVLDWLPFKGMAYTPLQMYLGTLPPEQLAAELAFQFAWTVALLFACEWAWRAVRWRLCLLGG